MVGLWSTECSRAQDLDLIWRWPWVGNIFWLSSDMWWEGTGKTETGCSQRYLGKEQRQTVKKCIREISVRYCHRQKLFPPSGNFHEFHLLPINNLLITDYRYQGRLKKTNNPQEKFCFASHTSSSPTRPFAPQCPDPRPCSALLLRQWPAQETGTSAQGAGSFTGSSFSRLHLSAPALAKPWTQPLPRYPLLSSFLLLCGLLLKSFQTKKAETEAGSLTSQAHVDS